jgi:hypothetical protein
MCTAPLPDLPVIDGLLRGEAPNWARQDAGLVGFLESERQVVLEKSSLKALLPAAKREQTLPARWYVHWRSLWPQASVERRALTTLSDIVKAHTAQLDRAAPQDGSAPYRRDLAQKIIRMFRRHAGTPVAVFCHLALVALDLERLRGDLVRRALFEPAKEAA